MSEGHDQIAAMLQAADGVEPLAAKPAELCVWCGKPVVVMAFQRTGYCCLLCQKGALSEQVEG